MSDKVALNYRYTATYNELTTRIAQRQQAMHLYVVVVAVIVAALANPRAELKALPQVPDEVASHRPSELPQEVLGTRGPEPLDDEDALPVGRLFLGIPIVSICFAFLTLKHELMIGNLRQYLGRLERKGTPAEALVSYNADEKWRRPALMWRRLHDFAAGLLVLTSNAFAFYVMRQAYPGEFTVGDTLFFVTLVVSLACFVAVITPAFLKRYRNLPDDPGEPNPAAASRGIPPNLGPAADN